MKIIKRTISILLSLLVLLVVLAVVFAYYYEDKIKATVIDEINQNLKSEINVKNIHFTFLNKFPSASLVFSDVLAYEKSSKKQKDTLLYASKIYLQFNVIDIVKRKYNLKKIDIDDGYLNIKFYKNGSNNYTIWETKTDKKRKFTIDMNEVNFSNVLFSIINYSSYQKHRFIANDINIFGSLNEKGYSLKVKGKSYIDYIIHKKTNYFNKKNIKLSLLVSYENKTGTYSISNGNITLNDIKLATDGKIIYEKTKKHIDINIYGKDLSLSSLEKQIPEEFKAYTNNYNFIGEAGISAKIKGSFKDKSTPSTIINYNLLNGEISRPETNISLKDISLKGNFDNRKSTNSKNFKIEFSEYKAKLKSGSFKGYLSIDNFEKPIIEIKTAGSIKLKDLQEFIPIDTIKEVTGDIDFNVFFNGKIGNIDRICSDDFIKSKTIGKINLNNASLQFINDKRIYKNLNGKFIFNNNDLKIDTLSGTTHGCNFIIKGYLKNLLAYLFLKNQKLYMNANLLSDKVDLALLSANMSESSDNNFNISFPNHMFFNINVSVKHLSFGLFKADKINGGISYKNKKLYIKHFSFNSMDGQVKIKGIIDGNNSKNIKIGCEGKLEKVDVNKLFYQFDDFSQKNITKDNLKGILSSSFQMSVIANNHLELDLNSLYFTSDIKIIKGELLNYQPIQKLSKFSRIKDLSNIKFNKLNNKIKIQNQIIFIPSMEINTDALNINLNGEQHFSGKLDYHLKILMSELLLKNTQKQNKENPEFSFIEDDGLGKPTLFIKVSGTTTDPKFKYDGKALRNKFKTDLIIEKQNIKSILNDEFGLFKKDSTLDSKSKKTNTEFQYEWEEEDTPSQKEKEKPIKTTPKDTTKKMPFKIQWDG